jgi:hypothetical protein
MLWRERRRRGDGWRAAMATKSLLFNVALRGVEKRSDDDEGHDNRRGRSLMTGIVLWEWWCYMEGCGIEGRGFKVGSR